MTTIIRFNAETVSSLSDDFDSVQAMEHAITTGLSAAGRADQRKTAENFKIGAAAERLVSATRGTAEPVNYGAIATKHAVSNTTISVGATLARVGMFESGILDSSTLPTKQAEKLPVQCENFRTFWRFATEGTPLQGCGVTVLSGLVGDDGAARPGAIRDLMIVGGSVASWERILNGAKFHEDDPRSKSDDDESGDDESGDDESQSGSVDALELAARAGRKGREQGHSLTELVAVLKAAFDGGEA